jgi:condensin complex subunit 1
LDKTLRIEMENPIFRRLQDAVEHPCRSKDWFGLAEQAINTIYALGEHPDILCNDLIKNLTVRAFSRRPSNEADPAKDPDAMDEDNPPVEADDTMTQETTSAATATTQGEKDVGDAFELSQVLFVVGHVAIKHIVYLELVEREWKRQKDEKQSGMFIPFVQGHRLLRIPQQTSPPAPQVALPEHRRMAKSLIR